MLETSNFIPGPIVELIATLFTYVPLAPLGLALVTALTKVEMFSFKAVSLKLALPIPA